MATILKFSEAVSIAFHTMSYLTKNKGKMIGTKEIAESLKVSENHLSKILQRLVKAGFLESIRGPKGGFILKDGGNKISLLEVYEAVDGPLKLSNCLFSSAICTEGEDCLFGNLIKIVNKEIKEYLRVKVL
jgi:Rrf2 family transcriptional regulator, nitric oxide-sensitive transcriptional repressor